MAWKDTFGFKKEIVLATSSKENKPRAIVVTSLGFEDNKLLIGICQMKKTFENLKNNPFVSLVAMENREYYRLNGISKIYDSGKYFDLAVNRSKECPPLPYGVLVIDIEEVFDVDNLKKVF